MEKVKHYSDQFKMHVVKEVLSGKESMEYYRRKYQIGGSMTISKWKAKFASEQISAMAKKENESTELSELRIRMSILERELAEERLRREAYQLMVKIAEEEFKIPIEKKSGVKQSKK